MSEPTANVGPYALTECLESGSALQLWLAERDGEIVESIGELHHERPPSLIGPGDRCFKDTSIARRHGRARPNGADGLETKVPFFRIGRGPDAHLRRRGRSVRDAFLRP